MTWADQAHDEIRALQVRQAHELATGAGLGNDLDPSRLEHPGDARAYETQLVGDDRRGPGAGIIRVEITRGLAVAGAHMESHRTPPSSRDLHNATFRDRTHHAKRSLLSTLGPIKSATPRRRSLHATSTTCVDTLQRTGGQRT